MKRLFAMGALLGALLSLPALAGAQTTFIARLSGAQEVPPIPDSTGSGLGVVTLDASRTTVSYNLIIAGLENVTLAHFHRGAPGVAGPVIIPIASSAFTHVEGTSPITPEDANDLLAGNLYLNVHTTAHGSGEIRGQLVRPPAGTFISELSGGEEVPPIPDSTGAGIGIATLDGTEQNVAYDLIVQGLATAITMAHFHQAPPGVAGPVIIPIASGPFVTLSGTSPITVDQVAALKSNGLYLNVHTTAHGSGEIRGQLEAPLNDVVPASESAFTFHVGVNSDVVDASHGLGVTLGTDPQALDTFAGKIDDTDANEDVQTPGFAPFNVSALVFNHPNNEPGWEGHGGLYSQDLRAPIAPGQSKTWENLTAISDLGSPLKPANVTLSWSATDLDNISSALQFTLVDATDADGDGIKSYDMRTISSFTYQNKSSADTPIVNTPFSIVVSNNRAQPRPVLTGLTFAKTGATSVTITYATDIPATTTVKYGLAADTLTQTSDQGTTTATNHSVTITGLTPNTPYFFQATSTAPNLEPAVSDVITTTTLKPLNAVGNITASNITTTGATINFQTDTAATAHVAYGTDATNLTSSQDVTTANTTQGVALTGLTPGTQYTVQVTSSAPGYEDLVQTFTFSTSAPLKANDPVITQVQSTTATVTITTTQAAQVTLRYGTDLTNNPKVLNSTTTGTTTTFKLTGLTPNTQYFVQADAASATLGTVTSNTASFITLKAIQVTTAPAVSNLTASSATVTLATDTPVTATLTYGNPPFKQTVSVLQATTNPTFNLTNLQSNTSYPYTIQILAPGYETLNLSPAPFTTPTSFAVGDVNGDNAINIADVTQILQFVIGALVPTADQFHRADVIPDNTIDLRDVTRLLRFSVGLEPHL